MPVDGSGYFGARELKEMMHDMYPAVEDERADDLVYEHPMTAVGIVLLSATMLGSVDIDKLMTLTGYSGAFISAIAFNMTNNKLWADGGYDTSTWLPKESRINEEELWIHIEIASGEMWRPVGNSDISKDPCQVYWDERGGFDCAINC